MLGSDVTDAFKQLVHTYASAHRDINQVRSCRSDAACQPQLAGFSGPAQMGLSRLTHQSRGHAPTVGREFDQLQRGVARLFADYPETLNRFNEYYIPDAAPSASSAHISLEQNASVQAVSARNAGTW